MICSGEGLRPPLHYGNNKLYKTYRKNKGTPSIEPSASLYIHCLAGK